MAASPVILNKSGSAPGRTGTEKAPLRVMARTRYGEKTGHKVFMESEQRFAWQKPVGKSDVLYHLPSTLGHKSIPFGTSTRNDWEATRMNERDTYNPNAGPGSYRVRDEQKVLSTVRNTRGGGFSQASRPSMILPSCGPGPVYDLNGLFKDGRDKKVKVGFNKDNRKPLADNVKSRTDAMYTLKFPPSRTIVFTKSTFSKSYTFHTQTPGPIYNLSSTGFRTGPKFSFGASKAKRFRDEVA